MIIILSPAKTLQIPLPQSLLLTKQVVLSTTQTINNNQNNNQNNKQEQEEKQSMMHELLLKELREMTQSQLQKTLGVSEAIARENKERYLKWNEQKQYPSAFKFDGPVYKALDCKSMTVQELAYLQKHLRIIDPLHGLLKPLDLIKQYRLEMSTKNLKATESTASSLAKFWSTLMTEQIINDLKDEPKPERFVLDLASEEYSKAIDKKLLEANDVGYFRMIIEGATYDGKYGRGCAARFCATSKAKTREDLIKFTGDDNAGKLWKFNQSSNKTVEGKSICFSFHNKKSDGGLAAKKKHKTK